MAITQPTYPVEPNELVTHVGAYVDAEVAAEAADRDAADIVVLGSLTTHAADTTSIHGIADTSVLATDSDVSTAVSTHSSDTTSVHGLSDVAMTKGVALHNGSAYPTRPTGFASVEWIGPDDPGGAASNGDTWVPTA